MERLGFVRAQAAEARWPGYNPRDLLKVYLYSEAECRRNLCPVALIKGCGGNTSKLTNCVKSEVIKRINNSGQSVAHRFDHVERVMRNALKIAATIEGVDYEILELAVLLHDVDQPVGRKTEHVELSLRAAEKILRQEGCPSDQANNVLAVIAEHSTEHVRTIKPSTNEARILFDANKIDGLAAVGIARVFSLFGQMGLPLFAAIPWYERKIEISSEYIQTDEGRRLFLLKLPYVQ